ncbi:hypothetical protein Vadar_021670 [Vaccinium darrowii]|uniref:Uncharacterized protein n=1 Tax=Vaccinium darrowii TaxID=229202 RepID=A0ACB7Y9I6_9ERIC|nr:hypothetical protein Vadar_021670 [Vaccinium darrowii]
MEMSVAVGLRTLFCVLGCVMLATLIYTLSVDGFPFRKDLLTPWMSATLLDFYINVVALGAWVCYKESNWISASLWMVMLVCFGSITTCFYIVLQFLKLSTYDALEDPIHYVLLRYPSKDGVEDKRRFSVVPTRIFFSALGCLMLATLVYTISTDGSPFRRELFTPWMTATLVDFYINVVALSHHNMHLYCATAIPSLISRCCSFYSPKKQQQKILLIERIGNALERIHYNGGLVTRMFEDDILAEQLNMIGYERPPHFLRVHQARIWKRSIHHQINTLLPRSAAGKWPFYL